MAKLTARARKAIPTSKFAGKNRSFPVEDRDHAIEAKRLVGRSVRAGNTTPEEADRIRAKADKVLGSVMK